MKYEIKLEMIGDKPVAYLRETWSNDYVRDRETVRCHGTNFRDLQATAPELRYVDDVLSGNCWQPSSGTYAQIRLEGEDAARVEAHLKVLACHRRYVLQWTFKDGAPVAIDSFDLPSLARSAGQDKAWKTESEAIAHAIKGRPDLEHWFGEAVTYVVNETLNQPT